MRPLDFSQYHIFPSYPPSSCAAASTRVRNVKKDLFSVGSSINKPQSRRVQTPTTLCFAVLFFFSFSLFLPLALPSQPLNLCTHTWQQESFSLSQDTSAPSRSQVVSWGRSMSSSCERYQPESLRIIYEMMARGARAGFHTEQRRRREHWPGRGA